MRPANVSSPKLPPTDLRAAREALDDCRSALLDFEQGINTQFQRSRWIGLVASLRLVGHVLEKVDGQADPTVRAAIVAAWPRVKGDPLFAGFIDGERNQVLKEGRQAARANIVIEVGAANLCLGEGAGRNLPIAIGPSSTHITLEMRDGPFAGRNPIELATEAIEFWQQYLDDIDRDVARRAGLQP